MLSKKQAIFATYLLNQIGIKEKSYLDKYLKYLEIANSKLSLSFDRYGIKSSNSYISNDLFESLIDEINLKKNTNQIVKKDTSSKIVTATDISNFRYCPVAFSISKSFEIEKPNGIEYTDMGKLLHEELLLFRKIDQIKTKRSQYNGDVYDDSILKSIVSSKLIFCGHSNEKKIFSNSVENYSGCPDYIFEDCEGRNFVVEEKFHKKNDPSKYYKLCDENDILYSSAMKEKYIKAEKWASSKVNFYPNHELQTFSYIRNIQDYKIKYGYLIYWYYDIKQGYPYIHRVEIEKLEKDESNEIQYNIYKNLLVGLIKNGIQKFDKEKMHPNKCAACVVSKYCGHKTGIIDEFRFPYDKKYLKVFSVNFPEELIKVKK